MHGWMDGGMDAWMDGWMHGWRDVGILIIHKEFHRGEYGGSTCGVLWWIIFSFLSARYPDASGICPSLGAYRLSVLHEEYGPYEGTSEIIPAVSSECSSQNPSSFIRCKGCSQTEITGPLKHYLWSNSSRRVAINIFLWDNENVLIPIISSYDYDMTGLRYASAFPTFLCVMSSSVGVFYSCSVGLHSFSHLDLFGSFLTFLDLSGSINDSWAISASL